MLCTDSDGGQDGRGASSFTSYMRVQSSDSLWECEVVCRRKTQLRRLWFPVRMSSRFCARLWHCESCSDHTRTQTFPWTRHTYAHTHTWVCKCRRSCVCALFALVTQSYVFLIKSCDCDIFWSETCLCLWFPQLLPRLWSLQFPSCCHIVKDSTVIMIVLLVMTKVITWWALQAPTGWINV